MTLNISGIAFSASYLVVTGLAFARSTPQATRSWALDQKVANRTRLVRWFLGEAVGVWFVVSVATFAVISAILMIRSDGASGTEVLLGSAGVVLTWLMIQTSFTLRYASAFHNDGAITLAHETDPDMLDFAYIAFTIGTSFTIVDASITSRHLRRVVLGHSLLSFAFNTVLLGLVVTFLAG